MVPVTLVTAHLLGLRASEGLIFYFLPLYTTYLVPLFKLSNVYLNYLLCLWVYTYPLCTWWSVDNLLTGVSFPFHLRDQGLKLQISGLGNTSTH